jgi:hypothetical protein
MSDDTNPTDMASEIQKVIDEDCRQSTKWVNTWWTFYWIVLALLLAGYFLAPDIHLKHGALIGFILTALGLVGLLLHTTTGTVRPPSLKPGALSLFETTLTRYASEEMEPGATRNEAEVGQAIGALLERAGIEIAARSWVNKVLAPTALLVFNRLLAPAIVTILSLYLLLVFHEPLIAAINFVIGLTLTQVQHYTMPTAAMKYVQEKFPQPTEA